MGDRTALYLYGVVPAGAALPPAVRGLNDEPVAVVACRGVGVLTHHCSAQLYQSDEQIHQSKDDQARGWVLAHHAVVSAGHDAARSILPIRFNSIIPVAGRRSPADVLRDWLDHHHDVLRARLEALHDRVELGITVVAAPWAGAPPGAGDPPREADAVPADTRHAPPPRGRGYFQHQLEQRRARERLRADEEITAHSVFEELATRADQIVVKSGRPVRDHTPEPVARHGGRTLVDLSVLVHRAAVPQIGRYLAGVQATPGLSVRFTGPWPPYAFTGTFEMPVLVPATGAPAAHHPATGQRADNNV